ncbi:hypothetical protein QE152_g38230 [Popillia japonica]|uniref:Uncharacterized protein n=1 Tax=Popillia japonica TaxID=7064 RepID=A0AAW1I8G4_POPJA
MECGPSDPVSSVAVARCSPTHQLSKVAPQISPTILDNAPSHPHVETLKNGDISVQFLPPNADHQLTDEDILNLVNEEQVIENSDDKQEPVGENRISSEETFEALQVALKFVEHQSASTPGDVIMMRHWRDIAASQQIQRNTKQTILRQYFKN